MNATNHMDSDKINDLYEALLNFHNELHGIDENVSRQFNDMLCLCDDDVGVQEVVETFLNIIKYA